MWEEGVPLTTIPTPTTHTPKSKGMEGRKVEISICHGNIQNANTDSPTSRHPFDMKPPWIFIIFKMMKIHGGFMSNRSLEVGESVFTFWMLPWQTEITTIHHKDVNISTRPFIEDTHLFMLKTHHHFEFPNLWGGVWNTPRHRASWCLPRKNSNTKEETMLSLFILHREGKVRAYLQKKCSYS